jgi:hypothetical protein
LNGHPSHPEAVQGAFYLEYRATPWKLLLVQVEIITLNSIYVTEQIISYGVSWPFMGLLRMNIRQIFFVNW